MNDRQICIGEANLEVFSQTLMELAGRDRGIVVVTSDSRGSGKLGPFGQAYPDQLVEVGIAEQNLVGMAAGLAAAGKKVFAVSPACFLTARSLEQIKNDVAYSDHPVKLVGISAGISYGSLGSTHHSLHDFAVLQAIHNLDIVAPADNFETREAILAAARHPTPLYLRFGKKPMPHLHAPDTRFELGKALQLTPRRDSYDAVLIAIGEAVAPALEASGELRQRGLSCCVLSLHSLRPFDEAAVLACARRARVVVTAEEHSIHGGLGSRVAACLMQAGVFRPLRIVGLPDEPTVTGSQAEIFRHYGISGSGLAQTALALLEGMD